MSESLTTIILGASILTISTISLIVFVSLYQRKLIKKKLENQQIQHLLQQQEIKTAYAMLDGQDKERKRIAAELHDNLGSILVTLSMYADTLSGQVNKQVKDITDRMSEAAKQANEEVRKISHSLDSGLLNHFGLKTAISQLLEAVEVSKNISIHREIHLKDHFTNETGLNVYRIVQELVTNSLKHSGCAEIRLEVNQLNGDINLIFEDNGNGFDVSAVKKGMGLSNIEKRVEKLEGQLTIDSAPGKGATFIIDIPTL
ncbi:MAG: sensor histidine kinase [Bacteroidota bacterium]